MNKILTLLNLKVKYRVTSIRVGIKKRYTIQSTVLGFVWSKVNNPIVKPEAPYEFKFYKDAEKKLSQLSQ